MISLARLYLATRPAQTVAILKFFQLGPTEIFLLFKSNGQIYGDIFTASGAEIDVLMNTTPGENNYIAMVCTVADGNSTPDVTSAVLVDQTKPVITIVGDNPQAWTKGVTPFVDSGATATDDIDGTLTSSIVADVTDVDVDTDGSYSVTYNVKDAAGNAATEAVRTVVVS